MPSETILVVDDEPRVAKSIEVILRDEGFSVRKASNGSEALESVRADMPDLVLLDIWMPGMDGLEVLKKIKEFETSVPIIMISGHGNIETAVKCTKSGAYDFLEKPLSLDKLVLTVRHALDQRRLVQNYEDLKSRLERRGRIIGESQRVKKLLDIIGTAAPTNGRVLISGENGTGKELIAKAIHNLSHRTKGPFVEVNCAAIPEELIESELFGHEKGSFTGATKRKSGKFELASGGTLFLDEIGDMSLKTQAKVLRALEEQKIERVGGDRPIDVDVRVIAASNKDLLQLIQQGSFREDLYYRLNVIHVHSPALRDRREDIPLLCDYFIRQFCEENGKRPKRLSSEALESLMAHTWPGNIRELRNVMERCVIMAGGDTIQLEDLPRSLQKEPAVETLPMQTFSSLKEAREEFERHYILDKLRKNEWNVTKTAEILGIERTNLHRKMKSLGIHAPDN